jgi:hypothetical protein
VGRFVQEDPLAFDARSNWYAYVEGRALEARDPFGLDEEYVWIGGCLYRVQYWSVEIGFSVVNTGADYYLVLCDDPSTFAFGDAPGSLPTGEYGGGVGSGDFGTRATGVPREVRQALAKAPPHGERCLDESVAFVANVALDFAAGYGISQGVRVAARGVTTMGIGSLFYVADLSLGYRWQARLVRGRP